MEECNARIEKKGFILRSVLVRLQTRYGIAYLKGDGRVSLDNLVDLSLSAYEQSRITFEKLEYLLSLNMITAEDVGISKPKKSSMPSDEELDGVPSA